jgi:hypothetical protein
MEKWEVVTPALDVLSQVYDVTLGMRGDGGYFIFCPPAL